MDTRSGLFLVLIGVLTTIAFLLVAPVLQYVLAAGVLAFLLAPVHRRLVSYVPYVGPRTSAIVLTAVTFLTAIVPLFLLTILLFDTALTFSQEFGRADIIQLIETFRTLAADLGADPEQLTAMEAYLVDEVTGVLSEATQTLFGELVNLVETTVRTSVGVVLLLFLLYYFLVDGTTLLAWMRSVSPIEEITVDELFDEIATVTWAVIGSHLLVAVLEGVLGGIGLWIAGVPNAAFWAVVMIIVSVLPAIGVWLIWGPITLWVFASDQITIGIFLVVYGLTALMIVDNYVRAIFVDRNSGVHPAIVLVGVIGGLYLLGITGLFLGPVLLAVLKATIVVFGRVTPDIGPVRSG